MLRRLLALAGLTALVVVQPILELFGEEPAATFGVNRVEGNAILAFAALVAVVPPVALWLPGEAARRVDETLGDRVHLATIAVLALLFGVILGREVSDAGALNLLIGAVVGLGVAFLYQRFEGIRSWVQILAAANLLFFLLFAISSPAADWRAAGATDAVALEPERSAPVVTTPEGEEIEPATPSVIVLVLDELPTQSIMDTEGEIDPVRFPNLASFAEDATWYRHHTTVNPFTQGAVPAILDGRDPFGGSTWQDHPENLFSLLAGSHHLVVAEVLTRMCGFETCQGDPVPPPAPEVTDPSRSITTTTTTAPDRAGVDRGARWGDLWSLTWDTWVERVRPAPGESPSGFDDFQEDLTGTPSPTPETAPDSSTTTTTTTLPTHLDDGLTEEERELDRFFATQITSQPGRHQQFVDALRPTDVPVLGYLHLILPHQPWTIREDGTIYDLAAGRTDYGQDFGDPWPVRVFRQRHLLQAEYADRLLGTVLARLDEIGLYDDSVIVVVGDHGAAFLPDQSSRSLTDDNYASIVYSPLLIKAPRQTDGAIDDQNVNITDIVPTIADLLGLRLPWDADGHAAGSEEIAARGSVKYIFDYTDAFDYTFLGTREYDDDEAFARIMTDLFSPIGPDDDPVAGLYAGIPGADLLGGDPDDHFGAPAGPATVADLERLRDPRAARLLGEIAGTVPGTPDDATVLVAVNGEIVGASPVYERSGTPGSFVILLPGDALLAEGNDIRIAVRAADGGITERTVS